MRTIEDLHNLCILKATEIATEHPYFIQESVKTYEQPVSIRILGVHDTCHDIDRVKALFTFKTRNGEDVGELFAVFVSEIRQKEGAQEHGQLVFEIGLLSLDKYGCAQRVVHTERMGVSNSEILVLILFYGALSRDCLSAFQHGWGSYRFPKEWRKSFNKSVKRFFPGNAALKDDRSNPAFYPYGTVVQFAEHVIAGCEGTRSVVEVCSNGAGSYLICTEHYEDHKCEYLERRESINIGHVERIIKRGTGPVYSPSMAATLYNEARANTPTPERSFYECQKRAEQQLFEGIVCSKQYWKVGWFASDFPVNYALTFRQGQLDVGFEHQFDSYSFLEAVSTTSRDQIDKKKFKRQMKRLHCYLSKLRHAVNKARMEDERSMDDYYSVYF